MMWGQARRVLDIQDLRRVYDLILLGHRGISTLVFVGQARKAGQDTFIQVVHVHILGGQDGTTCQKGWRAASRIQAAVYGVNERVRVVPWKYHLRRKLHHVVGDGWLSAVSDPQKVIGKISEDSEILRSCAWSLRSINDEASSLSLYLQKRKM